MTVAAAEQTPHFPPFRPDDPTTTSLEAYLGESVPAAGEPFRGTQLTARYDWYRLMREHRPVAHDPDTGFWYLFRHQDVRQALTDPATFSNALVPYFDGDPLTGSMLRTDPPRHRTLRSLVGPAFSARRIAALREQVRALVAGLLDRTDDADLDVVPAISLELPTLVIATLLGIDPVLHRDFQRWTGAFMRASTRREVDERSAADLGAMRDYFAATLAERRRTPKDDLIGTLVAAEVDGERLSDDDLLRFCNLLLIGGIETTTHLITNSVVCLARYPSQAARVRQDPALLPQFVDEVLRFLSPNQGIPRETTRDVELHGQVIPRGARVIALNGSAHRDAAALPDPDTFDLGRPQDRLLAFGHGIHYCLGAALAKLEAEETLTAMLARLPGRWEVPTTVEVMPSRLMSGLRSLPLRWTP
ncbi:cytochrome P450 [Kitasatospora sp. NPDC093102]|uniref:cytochrome P450 n=1 Tax=Kitasatospora sp. NPDC093102 TaxID=3155069 RepID=UPI00343DA8E0